MPKLILTTTCILGALAASVTAAPVQFLSPFTPTAQAAKNNESVTSLPDGLTNEPDALWRRDTMTDSWDGIRNQMNDVGFAITPVYEAEAFGAAGGGHSGGVTDGLIDIAFDFDLERLTHNFWPDAVFHLNVLDIYGSSLSGKYVGDISGTSNLAGFNTIRLQEMWLQQSFWAKRASLRAGMLAADSEFFASQGASLFLNGTFGAFTLIGANFNNAPVYPVAAPGVRFDVMPVSFLDFKAAVFAPNEDAENNTHGTDFDINSHDGALVALEASYLLNQSPNDRGLIGTYRVGTFIQQGDYTSWESQAANALDPNQPLRYGTNYMVYGVADQELFKNGQNTVESFVRAGWASSRFSMVSNYLEGGFNFTGFVPNRIFDVAGIAVARSGISKQFSASQVEQGDPRSSSETIIEATYKIQIAPWASIQPDLQYVINPSGVDGSRNAFVYGIRATIAF